MYKLILVDDDEEVREGILKKIDWEEHGFQIAGEAENGKEALEIVEREVPDVVITDIKMPFMDGITLSQHIREKFPSIKIIILTGFDEFEYAQKAIKLNVIEYLLKPMSSMELIEVLLRVKARIDKEIAEREDIKVLREHYFRSLPVLKEKFLTSMIMGKLKKEEILEKSQNYGINFRGDTCAALVLNIDPRPTFREDEVHAIKESKLQQSNLTEDMELLQFAVFNISEEIVKKYDLGIIFMHNEHIVIIASTEGEMKEEFFTKMLNILDEIRLCIERFLKVTITIGVGDFYQDIQHISSSYKNAVNALDYSVVLGVNRVIVIGDVEPKRPGKVVFDELKEHSLIRALKVGTEEEIKEVIDNLFREICELKASYKDYQIYLLELLMSVLKLAKDLGADTDEVFGINENLFVEMYGFKDIQEVKDWFSGICMKITRFISKDRQNTCKLIINEAKNYIQKNYSNSELTIDSVCKHLHISATYFSTLFKKETRSTFTNFLTGIRMEAAKELLRTTNLKAFEIAEKIGYSEPNYFSYCFKKNFNISPMEYRNSL